MDSSARELINVFELAADGIMLCAADGSAIHANTALHGMLEAAADRSALEAAISLVARTTAAGGQDVRHCIDDVQGTFCLKATPLRALQFRGAAILVVVTQRRIVVLSDAWLRRHHHLTEREVQIARFLAQGKSNSEIAAELGLSQHTVRHHAENVLLKLDVSKRAAVASALQRGGGCYCRRRVNLCVQA